MFNCRGRERQHQRSSSSSWSSSSQRTTSPSLMTRLHQQQRTVSTAVGGSRQQQQSMQPNGRERARSGMPSRSPSENNTGGGFLSRILVKGGPSTPQQRPQTQQQTSSSAPNNGGSFSLMRTENSSNHRPNSMSTKALVSSSVSTKGSTEVVPPTTSTTSTSSSVSDEMQRLQQLFASAEDVLGGPGSISGDNARSGRRRRGSKGKAPPDEDEDVFPTAPETITSGAVAYTPTESGDDDEEDDQEQQQENQQNVDNMSQPHPTKPPTTQQQRKNSFLKSKLPPPSPPSLHHRLSTPTASSRNKATTSAAVSSDDQQPPGTPTSAGLHTPARPMSRDDSPAHQSQMNMERENHRVAIDTVWKKNNALQTQVQHLKRQLQTMGHQLDFHKLQMLESEERAARAELEAQLQSELTMTIFHNQVHVPLATVANDCLVWKRTHQCNRPPVRDSELLRALKRAEAHIAEIECQLGPEIVEEAASILEARRAAAGRSSLLRHNDAAPVYAAISSYETGEAGTPARPNTTIVASSGAMSPKLVVPTKGAKRPTPQRNSSVVGDDREAAKTTCAQPTKKVKKYRAFLEK